jgi:hypothetical protein
MKLRTMILLAALAMRVAAAGDRDQIVIDVCVNDNAIQAPDVFPEKTAVGQGEILAAGMMASAGVRIQWHSVHRCPPRALVISFRDEISSGIMPGALAYARPFDGSDAITVFYDRIVRIVPDRPAGTVIGHVLAHEIAHILQGVDRHSETGLMKATWSSADFRKMYIQPLRFTPDDIELIQLGAGRLTGMLPPPALSE